MKTYHTRIDLSTDYGELEGIPATFLIDGELASLDHIQFNGLELNPHDAIKAFGHRVISQAELEIECRFAERDFDRDGVHFEDVA